MKHYTLTLVFNKDMTHVLMCYHNKQKLYNFIGGSKEPGETWMMASVRELREETGIDAIHDVDGLYFVREEKVESSRLLYDDDWDMFITACVLRHDIVLHEEKNELYWVALNDERIYKKSMGFGNCLCFLNEAYALCLMDKENCSTTQEGKV